MSNDIETPAVSDAFVSLLTASLVTLIVFLVAAFAFACFHPILFLFPALGLVGWFIIGFISEIAERL